MSKAIRQERLMKILLAPHVSEKSSLASANNGQYVFKVTHDANKYEISQAVEMLFNVKVDAVQVTNVKSKAKRFGSVEGKRKGWKKAYVKLTAGHKIEFMSTQA